MALERSVINYWRGRGGGGKPVLRYNNLTLGSVVVHMHIDVARSAWHIILTKMCMRTNIKKKKKLLVLTHLYRFMCGFLNFIRRCKQPLYEGMNLGSLQS